MLIYLLFFKMCCGKFSIFYVSHQRKAALILWAQPQCWGPMEPCQAQPSPQQTCMPVSHKADLCPWGLQNELVSASKQREVMGQRLKSGFFFCLFEKHIGAYLEHPYSLLWVCLTWTRDLIPGMCPDLLPHTWTVRQQSHPSFSLC